ncbi:o-succinylbenzoate synthase [Zhihengliuella halotolerans]|uniref:o-succinylbenzoate synthase n=1 Tax=Zhihengliuella halotolerans TaxID=370736 RepID=A0A4V2G9K2_9MICC|nr:o-succinylbenzoate synthase [Zhihengliuella halotolerans]RZU60666.1 O-succinylbenzoate synthase [Zhihengliuella halotolerans]
MPQEKPSPAQPLPELSEVLAAAHVVTLPLKVRFRGVTHREAVILRGPAGDSEFSPFLEYGDPEAAAWLRCALEAGWSGFPEPVRAAVPVNATVPAVATADVASVLGRYDAAHTVKVKVAERGQSLHDDVARVAEVRRLLPSAHLRIDANGGWDHDEALAALEALAEFTLQYAEQPVPGVEPLAELRVELQRRQLPVLIAADEAVRKEDDPLRVARIGAADLIVIKAQPLGGVTRALRIVADAGLPAVVSSALDTSVGTRAGAALAAALPELPYACGLATVSLFGGDVVADPYVARGGELDLRRVAADPDLLRLHAAPPERVAWWLERLRRCHELLVN